VKHKMPVFIVSPPSRRGRRFLCLTVSYLAQRTKQIALAPCKSQLFPTSKKVCPSNTGGKIYDELL
jgi:hypothetical protein